MSDPFVGEIRPVAFNFAPRGWALCNGQLLPLSQNVPLFSLLGTMYGGNGSTNFALPDLRTRIPLHSGGQSAGPGLSQVAEGEQVGQATVNLIPANLPSHSHVPMAVDARGTTNSPASTSWARAQAGRVPDRVYATDGSLVPMASNAMLSAGSGFEHNNMPPYLVINFIIALQGVFPPRP